MPDWVHTERTLLPSAPPIRHAGLAAADPAQGQRDGTWWRTACFVTLSSAHAVGAARPWWRLQPQTAQCYDHGALQADGEEPLAAGFRQQGSVPLPRWGILHRLPSHHPPPGFRPSRRPARPETNLLTAFPRGIRGLGRPPTPSTRAAARAHPPHSQTSLRLRCAKEVWQTTAPALKKAQCFSQAGSLGGTWLQLASFRGTWLDLSSDCHATADWANVRALA